MIKKLYLNSLSSLSLSSNRLSSLYLSLSLSLLSHHKFLPAKPPECRLAWTAPPASPEFPYPLCNLTQMPTVKPNQRSNQISKIKTNQRSNQIKDLQRCLLRPSERERGTQRASGRVATSSGVVGGGGGTSKGGEDARRTEKERIRLRSSALSLSLSPSLSLSLSPSLSLSLSPSLSLSSWGALRANREGRREREAYLLPGAVTPHARILLLRIGEKREKDGKRKREKEKGRERERKRKREREIGNRIGGEKGGERGREKKKVERGN